MTGEHGRRSLKIIRTHAAPRFDTGTAVTGGPIPAGSQPMVDSGSIRETQEHDKGSVNTHEIGRRQPAKTLTQVGPRHGCDLVDHHSTWLQDAGEGRGVDFNSGQWSLDRITRQGTDGNGGRGVEAVVLHNHNGTRLARVGAAGRGRVDVTSSHADSDGLSVRVQLARDGIDECLVVGVALARSNGRRLTVCLSNELRGTHVRHPDLNWAKPPLAQSLTMLAHPISPRHAHMLHVTESLASHPGLVVPGSWSHAGHKLLRTGPDRTSRRGQKSVADLDRDASARTAPHQPTRQYPEFKSHPHRSGLRPPSRADHDCLCYHSSRRMPRRWPRAIVLGVLSIFAEGYTPPGKAYW